MPVSEAEYPAVGCHRTAGPVVDGEPGQRGFFESGRSRHDAALHRLTDEALPPVGRLLDMLAVELPAGHLVTDQPTAPPAAGDDLAGAAQPRNLDGRDQPAALAVAD